MANDTKGSLKVQSILRSVLISGLNAVGFGGWTVVEFGSPDLINYDKCLTMQLLRKKRVGWQGFGYGLDPQFAGIARKDEWIAEYHYQVQALLKRDSGTDINAITAEDSADIMISWLNGPGITEFRKRGVAPLRIDGASIFVYNDNSDLYQKRAVFTVKIQVPKTLTTGENVVDALKPDVQPV